MHIRRIRILLSYKTFKVKKFRTKIAKKMLNIYERILRPGTIGWCDCNELQISDVIP